MTKVINLYGGPGIGKSTYSAELYATLKRQEVNCELVREYVKDWAWEEREIKDFDQYYFFGKQVRKESMLFEKVDVIITDSPILLCGFYADKYNIPEVKNIFPSLIGSYYDACKAKGIKHFHFMLSRNKPYNPKGRYQTEDEARQFDYEIMEYAGKILGNSPIETSDVLSYLEYAESRK